MNASEFRPGDRRLESWKEIAEYLQRNTTTARRWEKEEGLPVHRHPHKSRSSVFAYTSEIDQWRASRKSLPESLPPTPLWKTLASPRGVALAATLFLCIVSGAGMRPFTASAQYDASAGVGIRQQFAGSHKAQFQGSPDVSPDGRFLAYVTNGWQDLIVRDLSSGKEEVIVHVATKEGVTDPIWSPDNRTLAFSLNRTGKEGEIRIVAADGSAMRTVRSNDGTGWFATQDWSRDGRRILAVEATPDEKDFKSTLLWVDVASGQVQSLAAGYESYDVALRAKVSPDGKFILYGPIKGTSGLEHRLVGSDGSSDILLSAHPADNVPVGWSPDGRRAILGGLRTTRAGLWAFPVADGRPSGPPEMLPPQLCECDDAMPYRITSDGRFYFHTKAFASDLYFASLNPQTGRATPEAAQFPVSRFGSNVRPKWSPDGRHVLYYWVRDELREFSLFTPPASERRLTGIPVASGGYCWFDDHSILTRQLTGTKTRFLRVQIESQETTPLLEDDRVGNFGCASEGGFVSYRSAGGVTVRNLKTGAVSRFALPGTVQSGDAPLSKDGSRLTAVIRTPQSDHLTLISASADGSSVRELTTFAAPTNVQLTFGLAWSPDGRYIYFLKRESAEADFVLHRVPSDGGPVENTGLAGKDMRDIDISPDGQHIAYSLGSLYRPQVWELSNFLPPQVAMGNAKPDATNLAVTVEPTRREPELRRLIGLYPLGIRN